MADWTNIPNSSIEPGKPGRSIDALALRDNPIAIAEGAPGAPPIETNALRNPTAGNTVIFALQDAEASTELTSYASTMLHNRFDATRHIGVIVLVPGVIRCSLEHRTSNVAIQSLVRVIRNGTQVQEWSTTSITYQPRSVDVTVACGDVVIFQQRAGVGAGGSSLWRNLRISSGTLSMAVA
jgi:hypothetical protein